MLNDPDGRVRRTLIMERGEDWPAQRVLEAAERLAHVGGWALDIATGQSVWSPKLMRIFDLEVEGRGPDIPRVLEAIHPQDRERITQLLDDVQQRPETIPADGVVDEIRVLRRDGAVRIVRFEGRIEHDASGRPSLWLGAAQDVTDQRMAERELRARDAATQAVREWNAGDGGPVALLRRLAIALDLSVGLMWSRDPALDALTCRALWHAPELDPGAFATVSRETALRPGEGIPGRVWRDREPLIVPSLPACPDFRAPRTAAAIGLESGVAFPALADGEPVAVLSFYGREPLVPGDRLAQTLAGIGRELGVFLDRRRGDLAPGPLSARELEILRLASEGLSGPAIAERLVVSPSTVKTHFENLYEKLGVSDRAAAVAQALRRGLIE